MTGPISLGERERIRELFLAQGFACVGFASARPVPDNVAAWVAAGRHASLEWMARDPANRADPATLLPGVRTVVCVAASYPATDGLGAVAGYARGEDYHRPLTGALRHAAEALAEHAPGAATRVCVDTAPLLERAFAARAGLGWIGRNTMLLDETHGPWLLLGEVLTTLEIPPDEPATDRCGSCTACVDACPTGALDGGTLDGGALDSRRCLSYWTIEHRGELPAAWGAALEHRAFGCDDCLAACPFPRHASAPPPAAGGPFVPRPDLVAPSHEELRQRAGASFRRHFGSTPLERARKGGLLRNLTHCRTPSARDEPPAG
jgi:epoxyqueuosine reductase